MRFHSCSLSKILLWPSIISIMHSCSLWRRLLHKFSTPETPSFPRLLIFKKCFTARLLKYHLSLVYFASLLFWLLAHNSRPWCRWTLESNRWFLLNNLQLSRGIRGSNLASDVYFICGCEISFCRRLFEYILTTNYLWSDEQYRDMYFP